MTRKELFAHSFPSCSSVKYTVAQLVQFGSSRSGHQELTIWFLESMHGYHTCVFKECHLFSASQCLHQNHDTKMYAKDSMIS